MRTLSLGLLTIAITFGACKKDDDTPAPSTPGTPAPAAPSTTPNFVGADATLWAVKSFTTQSTPIGDFDLEIGLGVGAFTNDDFASFVNVGSVSLNSVALTAQPNNAYVLQPSATEPTGVDLSSVEWTVAGGNGFGGFTRTISAFPMPTVGAISSATTVVRSNGYTLSCPNIAGADSVIYLVGGVAKTLVGSSTSCFFSADELAGLNAGSNLVQIAAYRYDNESIDGKDIYFGKETVRSKSVTIQ